MNNIKDTLLINQQQSQQTQHIRTLCRSLTSLTEQACSCHRVILTWYMRDFRNPVPLQTNSSRTMKRNMRMMLFPSPCPVRSNMSSQTTRSVAWESSKTKITMLRCWKLFIQFVIWLNIAGRSTRICWKNVEKLKQKRLQVQYCFGGFEESIIGMYFSTLIQ